MEKGEGAFDFDNEPLEVRDSAFWGDDGKCESQVGRSSDVRDY
jgi:hypothetical protein